MNERCWLATCLVSIVSLLACMPVSGAETFRVATYNVEGYLDQVSQNRQPKLSEAKAKVRESIAAIRPDVLALQEMGSVEAVSDLRRSLKDDNLDFPYWEHVSGHDTNIHLAVLSRFPFAARRTHTNDSFLSHGRRFHVSRGFAEVDVQVNTNYSFTLITAHLKSRRAFGEADEAELRLEEARLLREKVDARLVANPMANIVVLGDFNDTKDSPPVKAIIGRGRQKLVDTRPAERIGGEDFASFAQDSRSITWTHYYAKEDTYSRIDFLLLSPGMAREWHTNQSYVLSIPHWGLGSDHRPLVAAFASEDQ